MMKKSCLCFLSLFAVLPLLADSRFVGGPTLHDEQITVAADVDGDGLDDLVGGRIYLNRSGTFVGPIDVPQLLALQSYWLDAIDVNDDGFADLVVQPRPDFGLRESSIHVYIGDGHGAFRETSQFKSRLLLDRTVDFDGDGRQDLIRLGATATAGHTSFDLLHNNGDGTFTAAQTIEADGVARDLVAADVNGDHRPDLAAISDDHFIVWSGGPNGQFGPARMRFLPFVGKFALADVNADGAPDLVLLMNLKSDRLAVAYNDGSGRFGTTASAPVPMLGGDGFVIQHFPGTRQQEIVLSQYDGTMTSYSAMEGRLQKVAQFPTGLSNPYIHGAAFSAPHAVDLWMWAQTLPTYQNQVSIVLSSGAPTESANAFLHSRVPRRAAGRPFSPNGPATGTFLVTITAPGRTPIVETWRLEQEGFFVTLMNERNGEHLGAASADDALWVVLTTPDVRMEGYTTISGDRITGTLNAPHDEKWDFVAVRRQ